MYTAPSLSVGNDTNVAQAGSIFGSVSLSQAEEYRKIQERYIMLVNLNNSGLIDIEFAKSEALEAYTEMKAVTKPQKYLGFVGYSKGDRNIINLFGLLDW